MDGYCKLQDGTLIPYPIDTQPPRKNETLSLEIIYSDKDSIIFLPKAMYVKFAIFSEGDKRFGLWRWDNTGGWKKILTQELENIEQAKHEFLPITKYF